MGNEWDTGKRVGYGETSFNGGYDLVIDEFDTNYR